MGKFSWGLFNDDIHHCSFNPLKLKIVNFIACGSLTELVLSELQFYWSLANLGIIIGSAPCQESCGVLYPVLQKSASSSSLLIWDFYAHAKILSSSETGLAGFRRRGLRQDRRSGVLRQPGDCLLHREHREPHPLLVSDPENNPEVLK